MHEVTAMLCAMNLPTACFFVLVTFSQDACTATSASRTAVGQAETGTTSQPQDARSLVEALKYTRTAEPAKGELRKRPVEEVIPLLARVLAEDAAFRDNDELRGAVYDVLASAWPVTPGGKVVVNNEQQLELLRLGLQDPVEHIRSTCARGLGLVAPEHQSKVVQWLSASLHDPGLLVVWDAADSLGRIGKLAEPALPELLHLLANPDEDGKIKWGRGRETYAHWPPGFDIELSVRTASAGARMSIAGVGVDIALYRKLDSRGQEAAVRALPGHLFEVLSPQGTVSENLSEETQTGIVEWCRFYLQDARDTNPEVRTIAVGSLLWMCCADRILPDLRHSVRRLLEVSATDRDPKVAEAAKNIIHAMDRLGK